MNSRKFRGIHINASHFEMAKNLDSVHELIDELSDLHSTWNNLSLLGELTNLGSEISDTRQLFEKLASELSNFLVGQATRQVVDMLATRAQNSIDILVRNLYERTADIGFLATDPVFSQLCIDAMEGPLETKALKLAKQRMRDYISNYSVYSNVLLLDCSANLITDLQDEVPQNTSLGWIRQLVNSNSNYAEAFRPLTDHSADQAPRLIYAWKIQESGQTRGFIALEFNLKLESEALFSKVMGASDYSSVPEWRVCGVTNSEGNVLVSSNPQYIGAGQTIRLPKKADWGVTQIGPIAYLTCLRSTRGYQGYGGPGWKGFCMVPLCHAFNQSGEDETNHPPAIDHKDGLVDPQIARFQAHATEIQKQLNRSIWNGNIAQRNSRSVLGQSFSKTLLWEISRAGESTKALYTQALEQLIHREIKGFQVEQQARAMLAIDLMDRNLYERANDCRWWALTPVLAQALTEEEKVPLATECLQHIHSLYTVYTNIVLLDRDGKVVCDSAEQVPKGRLLKAPWIDSTMQLKSCEHYCVSAFERTELYQDRPTYIYSAAIYTDSENPDNAIGAIALVFDSEPQFEAILRESMGGHNQQAFAFIVDEQQRVISSTTDHYIEQGILKLPVAPQGPFEKYKSNFGYLQLDGRLIAYGTCNSGEYREYKSNTDHYQNNLQCIYGVDVGALKQTCSNLAGDISFDEFKQATQKGENVDIACFRVGQHWYGIDSEDAIEAFICRETVTVPNSPPWIVGNTIYQQKAITVIDISKILNVENHSNQSTTPRQQMILLRTGDSLTNIAFAIDELGEIPSLPLEALEEKSSLAPDSGVIQALVKTSGNLLVVLNTEKLLKQLGRPIEKAPHSNKGLFAKAVM